MTEFLQTKQVALSTLIEQDDIITKTVSFFMFLPHENQWRFMFANVEQMFFSPQRIGDWLLCLLPIAM